MADPTQCEFLAVVSEWQGSGGTVGNAYPLVNVTTGAVVADPPEEFPNPGAMFLTNRSGLATWDFVLIRPRQNNLYNNSDYRQCYYIPSGRPEILENPNRLDSVAIILDHSRFDLNSATRQILNPTHNVTPLFFVQKGDLIIGPLLRDATHLSPFEDVQRIDWRPARDDGIVYESTREELEKSGIRLVQYAHPEPSLNRILNEPLQFAVGAVMKVTSARLRDTLPNANLIEWYLQRCPNVEISSTLLASLKAAFRGKPGDDMQIQIARLGKIDREMATNAAFLEHRERFARNYVESAAGQKRVRELIEQTVDKKASEVQAEVDKRQSHLAARRDELDRQLAVAERANQEQIEALERKREVVQQQIVELRASIGQLQASMSADVKHLAARVQEELPLFAAITAARFDSSPSSQASSAGSAPVAKPAVVEFRPIAPSSTLRPVEKEAKLVDELHLELARRGLHFARTFIANVYTCLKAEPLNLIIGPPGYGKSMLVDTLARSLGHENAFLSIAVRRSWSEDRYLLGFFDSFHGRYDPGATGLVPRMIQAAADWRQDRKGIYVVLLDEFNLAAPEYYFSQLLQALPQGKPGREITLYDGSGNGDVGFPSRVTLSPNLRFWGTINYDETTERLSPRTLDRTGMIFLGDADVKRTRTPEEERPPMPGVAASDLFEKFLRKADECPPDRWEIVSKVIDFLRSPDAALGPRVEISPRVVRAIERYLANSVDVLEPRTAVDFVVQQRILPVVRGRGDEFLARMRRLGQILSDANLSRSASHVEESLRRLEQQFGELDFLSY